jgi:hypothetical protein
MTEVKIVGYYTNNACMLGFPDRSDLTVTKYVLEDEKGSIQIIPPPINPPEIKPFEKDFARSQKVNPDWESISAADNRLSISREDFTGFFSRREINLLLKYLVLQIEANHWVENELRNKWGIYATFSKIVVQTQPWGRFNEHGVVIGKDLLRIRLGDPREFHSFVSPQAIYAHELGHHLASFDSRGMNIFSNAQLMFGTAVEPLKASLTLNGNFDGKYVYIPYKLLPSELLYRPPSMERGLLYYADELVADKVALQLCGYAKSKRRISINIKEILKKDKNPWAILHLLVLAREYNLKSYEKILLYKFKRHEKHWEKIISTEQLLSSLSDFFNKVTLKRQ